MHFSLEGEQKHPKTVISLQHNKSSGLYLICILTTMKIQRAGGNQCWWWDLYGVWIPVSWSCGHPYTLQAAPAQWEGACRWKKAPQSTSHLFFPGLHILGVPPPAIPAVPNPDTLPHRMLRVRVIHPIPATPHHLLPLIKIQVWPSPVDLIIF